MASETAFRSFSLCISNVCRCFMIILLLFSVNQLFGLRTSTTSASNKSSTINKFRKDIDCNLETFELYDGYEFVFSSSKNGRNYFHFSVENLQDCLDLCRNDETCGGINFDGLTCQPIGYDTVENGHLVRSPRKPSSFSIYGEKICITDTQRKCGPKLWAFEHIVGYHLIYPKQTDSSPYLRKQVHNVTSLQSCRQLCLNENSFVCRSALFNSSSAECVLAEMSRHTIDTTYGDRVETSAMKKARAKFVQSVPPSDQVHYIENKCIDEPRKFCDFRRLRSYKIKTADSSIRNVESLSECRELCLSNIQSIACKSFDYDSSLRLCRISHLSEVSSIHIDEPYWSKEESTTYEISTCYNVTIFCEPKTMKVQIETSKLFNGKIYAKSQPKYCANDISNKLSFDLSMPYINKAVSRNSFPHLQKSMFHCDTRQPSPGNFANDIIIQHHDLVLTTKDLALGVYCKFDLKNDSVTRIDLKIQGDIITDKLKGSAKLPELSLHIVDFRGEDLDEVSIGDILRVQVRMSDEGTYGIFVRNLIAKDNLNRTNNFTLIDNKGCPVEVKMMREVRTIGTNSKSLESYLEAFTFTGGSLLVIEAEVETCLDKCRPVQCKLATGRSEDESEIVTSYGRRRRRSAVVDIDQADEGDVLSMTMLSKSLLIRPDKQVSQHNKHWQYLSQSSDTATSVTPRLIQRNVPSAHQVHSKHKHKSSSARHPTHARMPSIIANERSKAHPDSTSPYLKVSIADKNYICFESLNLIVICALSFCIQGFIFSLVFYMMIKVRLDTFRNKRRRSPSTAASYNQTVNPYNCMH